MCVLLLGKLQRMGGKKNNKELSSDDILKESIESRKNISVSGWTLSKEFNWSKKIHVDEYVSMKNKTC